MPPSKKRKLQQEKYPCYTCGSDRVSSQFPDHNPTDECKHLINTCTLCLRNYIDAYMDNTKFHGSIPCPQCPETMKQADLEFVARKASVKRFAELEHRRRSEVIPGWQWCLNPKCTSGQVHEHPPKNAVSTESEEPARRTRSKEAGNKDETSSKKFKCNECNHEFCLDCTTAWHKDETCEQYQKRIDSQREKENAASEETVNRIAKKCPNERCQVPTERNGGCAHIYCVRCNMNWCWTCNKTFTNGQCDCSRAALAALQAQQAAMRAEQQLPVRGQDQQARPRTGELMPQPQQGQDAQRREALQQAQEQRRALIAAEQAMLGAQVAHDMVADVFARLEAGE